jgi:3D (Asp-Asp-Asp) domain-containing protein
MALGVFRNTYYDFPSEADHKGAMTRIFSATCAPIAEVPRGFHDAVCVQGSGQLKNGTTVSFARRDCECAEVCPRSGQKICFEALDHAQFPWGRGSTGKPIKPLVSVAVDPAVIPLGTAIYLPEYDGIPRDEEGGAPHDGCFLAQDRGSRVVGNHIDIFTGSERSTMHWNGLVPSNKGVTVVVNAPRCLRLAAGSP